MRIYHYLFLSFLCLLSASWAQDTARPVAADKAPLDFDQTEATANWLVASDRLIWAATEKVLAKRGSVEMLNPEAFCLHAADGWHVAFGILSSDGESYALSRHYRSPRAGDPLELLTGDRVSAHDAAIARALRATYQTVITPARETYAVDLRAFARPVADGIEIWVIGDRQANGQVAYGLSYRLVYSADGRRETSRESWGQEPQLLTLDPTTELRLGGRDQTTPTVADVFLVLRYGADLASTTIESHDFISQRLMVDGRPLWLHVRRPARAQPTAP